MGGEDICEVLVYGETSLPVEGSDVIITINHLSYSIAWY